MIRTSGGGLITAVAPYRIRQLEAHDEDSLVEFPCSVPQWMLTNMLVDRALCMFPQNCCCQNVGLLEHAMRAKLNGMIELMWKVEFCTFEGSQSGG